MTAIVGLVHRGAVHMGGDSAGSNNWHESVRADKKVFRNGPYLIGFTTSYRMGQLLHHAFKPPAPPERSLERFMTTAFVDAVRDCLKDGGWAETKNDREASGEFLVGVAGRLFAVLSDYQVAEETVGHFAVGSGYLVALGSLHATAATRMAPRKRLTAALEAAEQYTSGVRGPFTCLTLRAPRRSVR